MPFVSRTCSNEFLLLLLDVAWVNKVLLLLLLLSNGRSNLQIVDSIPAEVEDFFLPCAIARIPIESPTTKPCFYYKKILVTANENSVLNLNTP